MLHFSKRKKLTGKMNKGFFYFSIFALLAMIYDFGFDHATWIAKALNVVYIITGLGGGVSIASRYLFKQQKFKRTVVLFDAILEILLLLFVLHLLKWIRFPFFEKNIWVFFILFLVFLRELSAQNLDLSRRKLNPALLFVGSFFILIIFGAILLLLPKASNGELGFLDALFTSTSAVCVTGLAVVDTGKFFTPFGQSIILLLIQIGGIGIMTFTSYFSYFFRGGSSYENQLLLKDMTNSEKVGEVFDTLKKIILITFVIEGIGALLIYFSLDKSLLPRIMDRMFFAGFHSISSFCNAGFSTLSNSLYETGYRYNYALHFWVAMLFILGGIGFPIAFNFLSYIRYLFVNRLLGLEAQGKKPWVINVNTRIVLITTGILLVVGTIFFYIFEYDNTLAEHSSIGKIMTAFFSAATPRTAGFNSVDNAALHFSTIMVIFLLMWIGASPGSTGGGIKTTTFAIGTLNYLSLARGKDRIEVFHREISEISVRRAFATISLSFIVIGMAVFLVVFFDSDMDLLQIAFECFSAYSTVGLSLGITSNLSDGSKMVIIITMFIGRVSMLTILSAFLRRMKYLKYRYPSEDILIN